MTLDEMKLAVCEKLPKLIIIDSSYSPIDCEPRPRWIYRSDLHYWRRDLSVDWPTEGLQVCHEAERLLTSEQKRKYCATLRLPHARPVGHEWEDGCDDAICATYEQRLEALCRVWFPERFN